MTDPIQELDALALEKATEAHDAAMVGCAENWDRREISACIRAYLSALAEGGFVIAPAEPTEHMLEDALTAGRMANSFHENSIVTWRAMLAASPSRVLHDDRVK